MASEEHCRLGVDDEQGEANLMACCVDGQRAMQRGRGPVHGRFHHTQAKYALAEQIIDRPIESVTVSSKGVTGVLGTSDKPAATN
jgi:hypothetical protein